MIWKILSKINDLEDFGVLLFKQTGLQNSFQTNLLQTCLEDKSNRNLFGNFHPIKPARMILGIGFGGSLDGGLTIGVHPNTCARREQREPWEGCLTLHFLLVDRSRSYSSRIHRAVAS